jgi:hypothetical protein
MLTTLKEDWAVGEVAVYNCGCSPVKLPHDNFRSRERHGQDVVVLQSFTTSDSTHDAEVLPMFMVRFPDGYECELWADEMIGV